MFGEETHTAHYKPGQEEQKDKALEFELREHASQHMATQDATVRLVQKHVTVTGNPNPYIINDDRKTACSC